MANDNENRHLKELGKSSYQVAAGDSDIRGWVVKNVNGRVVGVVDDLVIDSEAEKVKYLVVDLGNNELQLRERKVLLPLDLAQLDVPFRNVIYPAPMANELAAIPTHEKGRFYYQTEGLIAGAFAPYYENRDTGTAREASRPEQDRPAVPVTPPPPPRPQESRSADQPVGFAGEGGGTSGGMGGETHHFQGTTAQDSGDTGAGQETAGRRPQTVVGVFDHTSQAQAAVEYLVRKGGFKRERIDMMLRDADDYDTTRKGEEHHSGMSEFFSNLFKGDTRAKDYSDAASTCSVVTLHTESLEEAEKAAEILDMHGAVNVEERYPREGRADHTAVVHTKRYQSLIIEYPEEGRVRGLR
ncbi:MAG TPA: PRC-barrel domain-containing protein [Sphingobacteriaceae bacterium]